MVVNGLFQWLVSVGYVAANPFTGIANRTEAVGSGAGTAERVLERTLPPAALRAVLDELDALEPNGRNRRTSIALRLLIATGMRISEFVNARREHLEQRDGAWVLRVPGGRSGVRELELTAQLVEDLERYLGARGLPPRLGDVPPGAYLVGAVDDLGARLRGVERVGTTDAVLMMPSGTQISAGDGVGPQAIHRDLDALFERSATACEARGDFDLAGQLRQASSNWLRHAGRLAAVRT